MSSVRAGEAVPGHRWLLGLSAWLVGVAWADATLPEVVVASTRWDAPPFDTPASVDILAGESLRTGGLPVNLADGLAAVPGVMARDRHNFAQDVQLSMRGMGARAPFGIRGLRFYLDGVPATLPDGQGQVSHVDLASVDRVEVLRGPFSTLHGNAAAGVIEVVTVDGAGPPTLSVDNTWGRDATRLGNLQLSGASGAVGYVFSATRLDTDGARPHSAAQRDTANAKLTWNLQDGARLTWVANTLRLPWAQDPLGLTRSQYAQNPEGVTAEALQYNTRKTVGQDQMGLVFEQRLAAGDSLRLMAYGGQRDTEQFQAIPVTTQANPLHPGGVIQLQRAYAGFDARWSAAPGPGVQVVAGLAGDGLREHRRGLNNFVGSTLGVAGALRRDEANRADNLDPYVQARWPLAPQWTASLGLRRSTVRIESQDRYVGAGNGDDSGQVRYSATLPVVSLQYAPHADWRFHAALSRGYETPTLNELAYRPDGLTGLNTALQPATSQSMEAGVKSRPTALGEWAVTVFQTGTDHEIVTQTSLGGRSTYTNAGRAQRKGAELNWQRPLGPQWTLHAAYTVLDAVYRDAFLTCSATPCSSPTLRIPAGNRLPGLARHSVYASVNWQDQRAWQAQWVWRGLSAVQVNDRNSDASPAYLVADAALSHRRTWGAWELGSVLRINNLFDRRYIGSVIVNEGNGRYFEAAPGRSVYVGVNARLAIR